MTGQTIGLLLVMIIYLILMVGIGVLYSKKNNDVSDFYLGGRKLGPIVTAMSAEASDMSSWLLLQQYFRKNGFAILLYEFLSDLQINVHNAFSAMHTYAGRGV